LLNDTERFTVAGKLKLANGAGMSQPIV